MSSRSGAQRTAMANTKLESPEAVGSDGVNASHGLVVGTVPHLCVFADIAFVFFFFFENSSDGGF